MTQQELLTSLEKTFADCLETARRKNSDYAGDKDALHNFKTVENLNIASTEQGFMTRMTDKFTRLATLIQPGREAQVKNEPLTDTLLDLINYTALFKAYLESKNESSS